MKNLDRLFQAVILVCATLAAVPFSSWLKPHLPETYTTYLDSKILTPIITALIYVFLVFLFGAAFLIPFLRRRFDKNFSFAGTYISFPANPNSVSIFSIKPQLLTRKYRLHGTAYSLSPNIRATGSWSSELLDMIPIQPARLRYIYSGNAENPASPQPFAGHGYSKIEFFDRNLTVGRGEFVDDENEAAQRRQQARYFKVTPQLKKDLKYFGRTKKWDKIAAAVAALPQTQVAQYRPIKSV